MTTGSEVLSYRGDPGLGLGSNASIPAIYSDNNVINQTSRDLMLLNHEDNVKKWEQKNKDRDKLLGMIADGQVATGDIIEEDRKEVAKYQKKFDDAYYDMVKGGGLNNQEGMRKYQKAHKELIDATTWAQHRFVGYKQLEAAKAAATLQSDKDQIQKQIDEQKKLEFYKGDFPAYQKALTYDAEEPRNAILKGIDGSIPATSETDQTKVVQKQGQPSVITKTTTIKPVAGKKGSSASVVTGPGSGAAGTTTRTDKDGKVYQVTQGKILLDPMVQNAIEYYKTPAGFEKSKMVRDIDETMPDNLYEPQMNHIIKRITDYNNDHGLKPSGENVQGVLVDPVTGYIDPKVLSEQIGIDPNTGKRTGGKIMMSTPDYMAIKTLASLNGSYTPKTEVFDEKATKINLDLQKEKDKMKIELGKLGLGYAKLREQVNKRIASQKTEEGQNKEFDQMWDRNIEEQKSLVTVTPTGFKSEIPAEGSLPVYTIKGGKVTEIDPYGQTITYSEYKADGKTPAKGAKVVSKSGGYYKINYVKKGSNRPIPDRDIKKAYQIYQSQVPDATFEDFIKETMSLGDKSPIDYTVTGQNGTTDRKLALAAQKKVANASQKKGQEGIFDDNNYDQEEMPPDNTDE